MKGKVTRWFTDWLNKYKSNVLLKRLSVVLAIDMLVKLSGFILLPLYLRLMSQEEYGLYGYLLSIIYTFALVLGFGLSVPLSKFYHDYKDRSDKGRLVFTIFVQLAILLFVVMFPVYFFGFDYEVVKFLFKNQIDYSSYRGFIMLAVVVSVCNTMLTSFFYTSEKIRQAKHYNIWRIICINVASLALLYFLREQDSVTTRLATTFIAELVLFLVFMYFPVKEMKCRFDVKLALYSLKLALPVMLSPIFGIVTNFSDKFFLEKYSFQDLPVYYLGISCASIIPAIFTSVQNAWFPLFIKEKDVRKNVANTQKISLKLILAFLVLSFCIVLFVMLLLQLNIIQRHYAQVIYVLPILLLTQILVGLTAIYGNYMVYFEKTYVISVSSFVICCISLVLGLSLVPVWGIYGAAVAALTANFIFFVIYYSMSRKYTKKYVTMP